MSIAAAMLEMTPESKSVVVGVTDTSIDDAISLARHAQEHGAAGVLWACPFFFLSSSEGVRRFLSDLDAALTIDLILYDNPVATKTVLKLEDILDWADALQNLRTVKLTDHDLGKIVHLQQAGLAMMGGDDVILFRYLDAGVDGAMVIAPAIFPASFRAVWDLVTAGDQPAAMKTFAAEILPLLHLFGIGDEIATTKAILAEIGIFATDELLPPLTPVTRERRELLKLSYQIATNAASVT
jgi:4-hydroxy-tetrahydrodipicolinate synthase